MANDGKPEKRPIRFLIADPNETISAQVQNEYITAKKTLGDETPSPVYIDTVRGAQGKISDRAYDYTAVFVNPSLGVPGWFAVVRACHQYRPGVPVFVLYEDNPKVSKEDASKLGVSGFVKKPLSYKKMYRLSTGQAQPDIASLEVEAKPATAAVKAQGDEQIQDSEVVEVDLRGMVGRAKSIFDLYVRLSNGKYVKILHKGDVLSADRVESYLAKGVKALFVLRAEQADYLGFYDSMVSSLLKDSNVAMDVKTEQVEAQGISALQFLKNSGFSEKSLEAAQKYVSNATEVVNQMAAKSDHVQGLLKDVLAYEHSVACTTMAGLMIKHIGGNNPAILNAVGIACFLHDIALVGQPPEVLAEDEAKMTLEQKALFQAHPDEGARIIKRMKSVPPIVLPAVAQHHLRMGKRGFPLEKAVDEVNRMAELVGLCHEFLHAMKRAKADPKFNPFTALQELAAKEFSPPLVDAFIRTFNEK
jgi:response regulator RpfG family c-di-GMP phosphodiesterase